ncbi:MAG TPA: hypothetical protein VFN03_07995, partial [Trueperaceae bacterium]|nr:hypothetical protein [Trueperaceae bacterium]
DTTSTGASFASVALAGEVSLDPMLALRLSTDSLTFDLRSGAAATPLCVASAVPDDVTSIDPLFATAPVQPAGTSFRVGSYPEIEVVGGQPLAPGQLPLTTVGAAIVCYRMFTLSAFSNTDGWHVMVDRFELPNEPPIENLYLAAVCRDETAVGLQSLKDEERVSLLDDRVAGACSEAVIVVAVKLGGEPAGSSAVGLRYTLMSTGAGIEAQ